MMFSMVNLNRLQEQASEPCTAGCNDEVIGCSHYFNDKNINRI